MNLLQYVFPAASRANLTDTIKGVFVPQPYYLSPTDPKLRDALIKSEGYRLDVYKDTRGFPTVGIGHLVTLGDRLKVGDKITPERAEKLFQQDIKRAVDAANTQAQSLEIRNPDFLVALAEVNFQLGTGWRTKFPKTWQYLTKGWEGNAINNLRRSAWNNQTPTRVDNFINAIRENFA